MKNEITDTCVSNQSKSSNFGTSPAERMFAFALVMTGITTMALGIVDDATAQIGYGSEIHYNATRINDAVNAIMTYLEGSFGALIMAAAGVGAIMSAAFGQYRASLKDRQIDRFFVSS